MQSPPKWIRSPRLRTGEPRRTAEHPSLLRSLIFNAGRSPSPRTTVASRLVVYEPVEVVSAAAVEFASYMNAAPTRSDQLASGRRLGPDDDLTISREPFVQPALRATSASASRRSRRFCSIAPDREGRGGRGSPLGSHSRLGPGRGEKVTWSGRRCWRAPPRASVNESGLVYGPRSGRGRPS